jgi:hypothetical protein
MTISEAYRLATDGEFRLVAGFTSPPRAGVVTALEASGQVRVAMDDADGLDVLAWPLNGFGYAVDDLVYVVFAADSPESGIVVGSKGSLPVLGSYVKRDGSTGLTADWDIGEDRRVQAEAIRARDEEGLRLEDDSGNLGLVVADGGKVGIGTDSPQELLDVVATGSSPRLQARRTDGATCQLIGGSSFGVFGTGSNHDLAFFTNGAEKARFTTGGRLGVGVSSPQEFVHAHDGVGGFLFGTVTGINSTTPIVILANGAGDVVRGLAGQYVVTDGTTTVGGTLTMLLGDVVNVVAGTVTVRFTLNANGQVDVRRTGGTGTGTVALQMVWL